MKITLYTFLILSITALCGCYYDVEEELYPTLNCDTAHVTYSGTITSLINNYSCLSCHGGASPSAGFGLDGYSKVKAKVDDGRLLGAISHTQGFAPMPQGMNQMNQCDINKLKAWIDAGAPNN